MVTTSNVHNNNRQITARESATARSLIAKTTAELYEHFFPAGKFDAAKMAELQALPPEVQGRILDRLLADAARRGDAQSAWQATQLYGYIAESYTAPGSASVFTPARNARAMELAGHPEMAALGGEKGWTAPTVPEKHRSTVAAIDAADPDDLDEIALQAASDPRLLESLTPEQKAKLVHALFDGHTSRADEEAARTILTSTKSEAELDALVSSLGGHSGGTVADGWTEIEDELGGSRLIGQVRSHQTQLRNRSAEQSSQRSAMFADGHHADMAGWLEGALSGLSLVSGQSSAPIGGVFGQAGMHLDPGFMQAFGSRPAGHFCPGVAGAPIGGPNAQIAMHQQLVLAEAQALAQQIAQGRAANANGPGEDFGAVTQQLEELRYLLESNPWMKEGPVGAAFEGLWRHHSEVPADQRVMRLQLAISCCQLDASINQWAGMNPAMNTDPVTAQKAMADALRELVAGNALSPATTSILQQLGLEPGVAGGGRVKVGGMVGSDAGVLAPDTFFGMARAVIDPDDLVGRFRRGDLDASQLTGEEGQVMMMMLNDRITRLQAMVDALRNVMETYNRALEKAVDALGR